MARLDELEQVDKELKTFRDQAAAALKALNELERLVSEFSELRRESESNLKRASERAEGLERYTAELRETWSTLEADTRATLEKLKDIEAEVRKRFDELQQSIDRVWTETQEDNLKVQNDLLAAQQHLRAELEQTIKALREESGQHFSEVDGRLDRHSSRIDEIQQESEQRWTKQQDDLIKVQNDLLAAQRNIRSELGRMINDLYGESEQRFSEFNKSLDRLASMHEEAIQSTYVHIDEVRNKLVTDLDGSRREYRESFSKLDTRLITLESQVRDIQKRIGDIQTRIVWMTMAQVGLFVVLVVLFIFLR